jgi:predicted metalloprotease
MPGENIPETYHFHLPLVSTVREADSARHSLRGHEHLLSPPVRCANAGTREHRSSAPTSMRWTPGHRSRNVEDRRGARGTGGGGGMRVGLGGMLVLLILSVVFKRDFLSLAGDGAGLTGGAPGMEAPPADISPAEDSLTQFIEFVLDDAQQNWSRIFANEGQTYPPSTLVLYRSATPTACGTGQSAAGPFYCPGDQNVYIDLDFFEELHRRFGAAGDFAQAYVLAHEIGHHVQTITGTSQRMRQLQQANPSQANQLSVRLELQADCYAGVWAHSAAERGLLEEGDVEEGLNAAAAVGDDRLQQAAGARVTPEGFTHGTSAQRMEWFRRGLTTGRVDACDTFRS